MQEQNGMMLYYVKYILGAYSALICVGMFL